MKLLLNFNVNGSIYVDKRGARIVNEGARRDVIRDAVLGTPERYAYTVCDNENFTSYDEVNRAAIMKGRRSENLRRRWASIRMVWRRRSSAITTSM